MVVFLGLKIDKCTLFQQLIALRLIQYLLQFSTGISNSCKCYGDSAEPSCLLIAPLQVELTLKRESIFIAPPQVFFKIKIEFCPMRHNLWPEILLLDNIHKI